MNKNNTTQQLVRAALLIALGLILPQAFHSIKNAGSIFLPMHIPVLLAGFFVNPIYALCVGVITPILSFLFTGMPPVPYLYIMIIELGAYGLFTSLLYNKIKCNTYISLVLSMLLGRIMSIIGTFAILHLILSKPFNFKMVATGLFVTGLPGIIIQLVIIPLLVMAVNKSYKGASYNG